jgi:hypothetical protein
MISIRVLRRRRGMVATQKMSEASIAAVVIRADGTREDLGVVSYWHRRWWRRAWWRLTHRRKEH